MAANPAKYDKFIEELPKNNYTIKHAAIKAGFKESTAKAQGKRLMQSALKHQARKVLQGDIVSAKEGKRLMSEIVGLSREDVMKSLSYIAKQTKDLNSALKVLAPLAKEYDVVLNDEGNNKTIVPTLNITVKETLNNPIDKPLIEDSNA